MHYLDSVDVSISQLSSVTDMLPIKRTVKNCKQNRGHIYMGRKRIEARIKKEAVETVKSGKLTQSEASRRLGVGRTSIRSWISRIESEGVAGLEKAANGNREIVVRLKIHPGYHIYAYVAESDPFVTTQVELQLPEGWTIVGKPKLPSAKSYNKQGTTVYEDEAIFRYEISGSGQGEAKCTVSYQCCDAHICFPPIEKELKEMLK